MTYDENGFYGHPDHINAHRIAARAYELAGDPAHRSENGQEPWAPQKLYYTAVSQSAIAEFGRRLREAGIAGAARRRRGERRADPGAPLTSW